VTSSPRFEAPAPGGPLPRDLWPIPPRRVHRVGVVLLLGAGQWRYTNEPRPLMLLVNRVRLDISGWYAGDWVWIEGAELDRSGTAVRRAQALVHVDAIPDSAAESGARRV
jgi:hypothetical protein